MTYVYLDDFNLTYVYIFSDLYISIFAVQYARRSSPVNRGIVADVLNCMK